MKKTFSLLAVAALAVGSALNAGTITVSPPTNPDTGLPETVSSVFGTGIAQSATLINTATEGIIYFDTRGDAVPAPFDVTHGTRVKNLVLSGTLPTTGDELVLDFTTITQLNLGYYLKDTAIGYLDEDGDGQTESFDIEYLVVNFDNTDFAEWYATTPTTVTGKFKDDITATGYVIASTCDQQEGDTSYGGIVFFNARTTQQVLAAEKTPGADTPAVPEPTTATLSLLALAGLAARRRRK